jgi:hypothetical protein
MSVSYTSVRVEVDWFSVIIKLRTIIKTIRPVLKYADMVYIVEVEVTLRLTVSMSWCRAPL